MQQCGNTHLWLWCRYANFLLSAKKDGQAARTQLQLAAQSSPTWLQRYFIYVSQEYAKKIKSLTEGIGERMNEDNEAPVPWH